MITIRIDRAQPVGQSQVPSMEILFDSEFPRLSTVHESAERFERQAADLEYALHMTLPGGTYSRLLEKMLRRRASHFVVSFGGIDEMDLYDEIKSELDKERLFISLYLSGGEKADELLEQTRYFDQHPDWYDNACLCQLCCSYGDW